MLVKVLVGLVAVVAIFLIYVAFFDSGEFKVRREVTIHAPPEVIYAHVIDLHKFDAWNPFSQVDPNKQMSYSGPAQGVGASTHWQSTNAQTGMGTMTIVSAEPFTAIRMRLDFEKPFRGTSYADYGFRSQGDLTVVSWTMVGTSAFIPRLMCHLFVNLDKMMGESFIKGLTTLKQIAESEHIQR